MTDDPEAGGERRPETGDEQGTTGRSRDRRTDERPTDDAREEVSDDHLDGVPAGAGCTGIWEHLSEQRREDDE